MSLRTLLTETATVIHPEFDALDDYGNEIPGTETSVEWPARLEQLSSTELVRDRDTVVADWRMFLPAGATIGPFDRVESAGRRFEVWGDPIDQRTPRGAHHLEVHLRWVSSTAVGS